MDFGLSERTEELRGRVRRIVRDEIIPHESETAETGDAVVWTERPWAVELKERCRAEGLWNLFLPDGEHGAGLTNLEYATLAEEMGRSPLAPEIFNCNAPDTGNIEVLYHFGSEEQKREWMLPLLEGRVRSGFAMTEPGVASSDATNMEASARIEGDEVVLDGTKWWTTGAGHPNCEVFVFMGVTDPDAHRHRRHSMVLVPRNTPGVTIDRMLPAMGRFDEPYGHAQVSFDGVRLPASAIIAGPGMGFLIAQGRLGPGRVHHCMRLIGLAERALELACKRGTEREAFGKPLVNLGGNRERIAEARMAIDQARLLVLRTAWLLDTQGVAGALSEVAQIKAAVPTMAQNVIDFAIQIHGGAGVSDDFPLAGMWTAARSLRLADGPDEVHRGTVARYELRRQAALREAGEIR